MKLAEALILRSDIDKKIQSFKERLGRYATVQQGDTPHEDPEEIFREACGTIETLESLVVKIQTANTVAKLKDGRTIAVALAEREALMHQHSLLSTAIEGANKEPSRYSASEIKWVTTISIKNYQKRLDDCAKKIRDLNVLIQEANWHYEMP